MFPIAEKYVNTHGDNAINRFVADLMADDPASFKQGYSRENAIIATADAFDLSRNEVENLLKNKEN